MQMALKNRRLKESALKTFLSNSAKHNFMMFLSERNFDVSESQDFLVVVIIVIRIF